MGAQISIDVKNRTIQSLMDEVNSGKYFLPSFQRQYVWDEDDIKGLVNSVISNHPIGTIILWKPSTTHLEAVDPFSKPLVDTGRKVGEINYIIDGQQRLTSLLLMFNSWKITRGGEEISVDPISYNLTSGKFYIGSTRGIDLSKLIKGFCLQDIGTVRELINAIPPEKLEEIKEKIRKILDYPISMYLMETTEENESTFSSMAEAFIKVNKLGVRIGNLELMLSFLAGAISGDLKGKIRGLYESLYEKFAIDLQPVIRFAFSRFGLKQTQISKVEQFRRNINKISVYTQSQRNDILDHSETSLKLTVELLGKQLGIHSSYYLPSQTALVPIAAYFYKKNPSSLDELTHDDVKNIVNWFILASFNGYYSSSTDTKLDRDLVVIDGSNSFPYQDLINNMGERNARVKITFRDIERGKEQNILRMQGKAHLFLEYILLVKNHANDWTGVLLPTRSVNELARHHIFPKDFLQEELDLDDPEISETYINNLGNITWIQKGVNSEIGETPPSEYLSDYEDSLEAHFIPSDKNLWTIDQYATFLDYRIRQICASAKRHFGDIVTDR